MLLIANGVSRSAMPWRREIPLGRAGTARPTQPVGFPSVFCFAHYRLTVGVEICILGSRGCRHSGVGNREEIFFDPEERGAKCTCVLQSTPTIFTMMVGVAKKPTTVIFILANISP